MSDWFWRKVNFIIGCITFLIFFSLVLLSSNIEIKDYDLWLHLAAGRYILTHFTVPHVDIFSCTIAGQFWNDHEWLFQTVIAYIYQLGGADGLVTFQAITVTTIFLLLAHLGFRQNRHLGPIFMLLLTLLIFQTRMTLRPDLISILFFVSYIYLLSMGLHSIGMVALIFIIQVIWVNFHGFFIFGPLLIILGILAELAKRHLKLPYQWNQVGRLSDEEFSVLMKMGIAALVACFVNPHFIEGAVYPLKVIFSYAGEANKVLGVISELRPPLALATLFSLKHNLPYKLMIIISLFSFIYNRKNIDLSALLFWMFFLIFSLLAIRNLLYFAVVAYLVFLINFDTFHVSHFLSEKFKKEKLALMINTLCLSVLLAWMLNFISNSAIRGYFNYDTYERKSEYGGVSLRNFPYKAVDFLNRNGIKGNFFNNFNAGSYLLGRTYPNIRVFIDGRTEVYGVNFNNDYLDIMNGNILKLESAIAKYKLKGAYLSSLIEPIPAKVLRYFYKSENWELVYFDYDAVIFLKNDPENMPWIKRLKVDLKNWGTPKHDITKIGPRRVTPFMYINRAHNFLSLGLKEKARAEVLESLIITPNYGNAFKILGRINLVDKDYQKAYENTRKALLFLPRDSYVQMNLARAAYGLGDFSLAEEICMKLIAQQPDNKSAKELYIQLRMARNQK